MDRTTLSRKKLRNSIVLAYFLSSSIYAGAWVQKKGEGLNILTLQRYLSQQSWTSAGRLTSSPTYAKNYLANYTEYGVTENLTLGLNVSALQSHTSAQGTRGGLNDTALLMRYLLWSSNSNVLSIQLFGDKLGHAAQFNIPPQNSGFNSGEAILIGTGGEFKTNPKQFWFADASFGLVQRYSAGNQAQIILEAGYKFNKDRTWLFLQNYNTFDYQHISSPQDANYNLVTIAPSIVYWLNKTIGIQLGMTQDLYGQNVGKGTSFFIANWIRF